jgi:hypothetical protein
LFAYALFKRSRPRPDEEDTGPQPAEIAERPDREPLTAAPAEPSSTQDRAFLKTLLQITVVVLIVSAAFGIGAWLAIRHWADHPGGGGWINFSGLLESLVLWSLQILASVICFFSGSAVAARLSRSTEMKLRFSLPLGLTLGLIAAGSNFVIDAVLVMILMASYVLP